VLQAMAIAAPGTPASAGGIPVSGISAAESSLNTLRERTIGRKLQANKFISVCADYGAVAVALQSSSKLLPLA
jgi:hypothetical protein